MPCMSLGMHGLIANIYDFSSFNLIVSFNRVSNTPEVKMETGTVKWFNQNKGFGFIERENEDKDLFVHMTEVQGQINDGDKVEFEVGETEKGPAAQKVKKVD
mgnify:FL=1|jgi:CspA family cold shock protein